MVRQVIYVYGGVVALFFFTIWEPTAYASVSDQTLKETIVILDRARANGISELQRGVDSGTLSDVEAGEFRKFLSYLGKRIHYYCGELAESVPVMEMESLPCSYQDTSRLPKLVELPPSPQASPTSNEQIDDLDTTLQAALGQFDEMLLSEQEKIDQQQSSQPSPSKASSRGDSQRDGHSGKSDLGGESNGEDARAGKQSQAGARSQRSAGGAGSANREVDSGKQEDNRGQLPPEEDDDIVARQLREAAEKETDPEIKEKLWDEYRKYKEGIN